MISEKVYSEVEGKLDVGFDDRGDQQLKNISKPVRAFAVRAGVHGPLTERLSAAPPLPDKPSIAVLPFENLSGDPEQEYFADGMVEEIITALSRFKWLFVIARTSSFTFTALLGMGMVFIELGRFDEAIVAGKKIQRQNYSFLPAYRCLASAFAHLERDAEAREAAARLLELDPAFTISAFIARGGLSNAKLLIEGLRKAGLPE